MRRSDVHSCSTASDPIDLVHCSNDVSQMLDGVQTVDFFKIGILKRPRINVEIVNDVRLGVGNFVDSQCVDNAPVDTTSQIQYSFCIWLQSAFDTRLNR